MDKLLDITRNGANANITHDIEESTHPTLFMTDLVNTKLPMWFIGAKEYRKVFIVHSIICC